MACATPMVSQAKAIPNNIIGLNLGNIKTSSYLGEPLKSTIPILFTSKKQASKLKVRLAPSSVYRQLGAERSPELNNLHFEIISKTKKTSIALSSKSAIHAPFLNFILEIESPQGSIYQDFTAMLDPRGYNTSHSKPTNKNVGSLITATQYKIQSGDSLSKISQKFKSNRASLNRMMEAIHLKNPTAFIDNDINRIKSGKILNLPTLKEIQNTSLIVKEVISIKKSIDQKTVAKSVTNPVIDETVSTQNTYTVKSGDTLSKITRDLGMKGRSFTKMMRAIHSAKPHAFSKNRINVLKINALLTIPSFDNTISGNSSSNSNVEEIKSKNVTPPRDSNKQQVFREDSQPIKNTANIDTTLVKQLKAANNEVVENLEKRLRELRSKLYTASAESSSLKAELVAKSSFISKQNNKVAKLQDTLINLKTKYQTYFEESYVDFTDSSTTPQSAGTSKLELPSSKAELLNTESTKIAQESKTQQSIEQIVSTFLKSKSSNSNDLLSIENLSYASLALVLGFLLLHRRRELNTYTPVSIDTPLKNSSKDIIPLNTYEDSLCFDDTVLAEIKENNNTHQNESEFTEEKIHECELLVDELIEDLEDQFTSSDDKVILESACEQEIQSILEDEEMDFDNFIQENIFETIQTNKPSGKSDDDINFNILSSTKPTINSFLHDTVLFQDKMDILVQLVNKGDEVIKQETDIIDHKKATISE